VHIRCLFFWVVSPELALAQGRRENHPVSVPPHWRYPAVRGRVTARGRNRSSGGSGKQPVESLGQSFRAIFWKCSLFPAVLERVPRFPQVIHALCFVDRIGGAIDNPDLHRPIIIIIPSFKSSL